jgi:TonB family protein
MRGHLYGPLGAVVAIAIGSMVAAAGCGGPSTEKDDTVQPGPCPECTTSEDSAPQADSTIIPEEKYEEIEKEFRGKTQVVSRCYVEGFEAGEVEKSEKGAVTVSLTIQPDGHATNVRVSKSSFRSKKVGDCVVRMVSEWTFTTLPKALDTSHTYVLDRL